MSFKTFMLIYTVLICQIYSQTITDTEKTEIVNKIESLIVENYVFEDVAKQSAAYLQKQLKAKKYATVSDLTEFAAQLTGDLQTINKDKHMRVRVVPPRRVELNEKDPHLAAMERNKNTYRQNFGFRKVEILDGNIGYVDFRFFSGNPAARQVVDNAMTFLENTDAIIFDMRKNGGGNPDMVRYICSYFFDKPTHLNSLYWRQGNRTVDFWTLATVGGRKHINQPVYILTSNYTFSGAEEFSYNFKTQKRALLIGETTGGGANPGGNAPIRSDLTIFIPTGRAINPITKTNWEGTGVEPDFKVSAEEAWNDAIEKATIKAEEIKQAELKEMEDLSNLIKQMSTKFKLNNSDQKKTLYRNLDQAINKRFVDESFINQLGYNFMGESKTQFAIAIFEYNVDRYPDSSNVYDSLGEAYMTDKQTEKSIKNYQRSLELDPSNTNAKKMIEKLRSN